MENRAPIRIFADDSAVTFNYWEIVIRRNYSQPEKELMLAVLKDAIMNYKKRMHLGNVLSGRPKPGYSKENGIGSFPLKRSALS
jgi:hypothetical protein